MAVATCHKVASHKCPLVFNTWAKKGLTAIFVLFSEDEEERRHAEQAGRGRAGM